MNPIIQETYLCENCKAKIPNIRVKLAEQDLLLLCCPNMACELSGDTKILLPPRLGCEKPLVVTDFIIPGSMASLVMQKNQYKYTHKDYAMSTGIGGPDECEIRR